MEISKKVEIDIRDDNGNKIEKGNIVYVSTNEGKCIVGTFVGLTNRKAFRLNNLLTDTEFSVATQVITHCQVVD